MNTSTNKARNEAGGAFADGLTLVRFLLTPVVMLIVIIGWPENTMALLASVLFAIAALTDIFDDLTGGAETAVERRLGWFDDIADMILAVGTLLAMTFVIHRSGQLAWAFAVPVAIIVLREVLVGILCGRKLVKYGWPESTLSNIRTFLTVLAVCTLLASPWLTTWFDAFRSSGDNVMEVYGTQSPYIWWIGQTLLWVAALLSLYTGAKLIAYRPVAANDS